MGIYGCERTELQKSSTNDELISTREITACNQCPNQSDCCCAIELLNSMNGAVLRLCGTTDGAGTCSSATPPSPCSSINGGGQTKTLSSGDPKLGFCMVKGNSFFVKNIGSGPAAITITCQYDLTHPQKLTVTIPKDSTYYYITNNTCVVDSCHS